MSVLGSALIIEIILIIVFVLVGVYVWSSIKTIYGAIIGVAFILIGLFIGLVAAGLL